MHAMCVFVLTNLIPFHLCKTSPSIEAKKLHLLARPCFRFHFYLRLSRADEASAHVNIYLYGNICWLCLHVFTPSMLDVEVNLFLQIHERLMNEREKTFDRCKKIFFGNFFQNKKLLKSKQGR